MYTEDLIVLGGSGFLVLAVLFLLIAKPRRQIVPEDLRLIIFRRGCFKRIVGPGPVSYWKSIETAASQYSTKEMPYHFRIPSFVTDIPVTYDMKLWLRIDLEAATAGDKHALRESANYTPEERSQHIEYCVKDTFSRVLMNNISQLPSAPNASLMMRLLPYVPYHPNMLEMLKEVQKILSHELRSYGAVVNLHKPLMLVGFEPSNTIIKIMNRGLEWKELAQQVPKTMTPDEFAIIVNLANGTYNMAHQRYTIDANSALSNTEQKVIEGAVLAKEKPRAGHRDYARDGTVWEIAQPTRSAKNTQRRDERVPANLRQD